MLTRFAIERKDKAIGALRKVNTAYDVQAGVTTRYAAQHRWSDRVGKLIAKGDTKDPNEISPWTLLN